jgi:hypothetical protein
LLGEAGYEVDERPVNLAENRASLTTRGFDSVPVVVVGGKAFPGFPRRSLLKGLGLAAAESSPAEALRGLSATLDDLEQLAGGLPSLSQELWPEQAYTLNPERDHTLGHLAWSIFRFVELTREAPARAGLPWSELVDSTELRHWRRRPEFASFADVSAYGRAELDAGRRWAALLRPSDLAQLLDTPWGRIDLRSLIEILGEHSQIKVKRLKEARAAQRITR